MKRAHMRNWFSTGCGMVVTGVVLGVVAAGLQYFGNPPNMGLCMACFARDSAGALGLHRSESAQYLRPEILGIVLGAMLAALATGEFRARAGASPFVRFLLGAWSVIGALVFLGCPWRALLRLAAGDWNAGIGMAGLAAGIFIATRLFTAGYEPGPSKATYRVVGFLFPALVLGGVALLLACPPVGGQAKSGVLFHSLKGPGAMHAPFWVSLAGGALAGVLLQRSRFCTIGGFRDLFLFRQWHLLRGVAAMALTAFVLNLALGRFTPGVAGQPIAHTMGVWNFLGMMLAGLAFTMAGGCPGRQCVLAGEGDTDAASLVLGMLAGAAFAHNFGLAGSPAGVPAAGQAAVVAGLAFCGVLGFGMRAKEPSSVREARQ